MFILTITGTVKHEVNIPQELPKLTKSVISPAIDTSACGGETEPFGASILPTPLPSDHETNTLKIQSSHVTVGPFKLQQSSDREEFSKRNSPELRGHRRTSLGTMTTDPRKIGALMGAKPSLPGHFQDMSSW